LSKRNRKKRKPEADISRGCLNGIKYISIQNCLLDKLTMDSMELHDLNKTDACCSGECGAARAYDTQKGRRLEYLTLGWNLIEAGVAVAAGVVAGSIALIGFGVDSLIESLSGGILLWRLQLHEADERRELIATKLVGVSFFVLAAYVAFDAAKTVIMREEPHVSAVGIVLACASLAVMPLLARAKRRVAARLDSRSLEADSRQTDLCAYLSAILLGGLALNAFFGWWWADPVAGFVMVPIIAREGIETLRGDECGACH
jgi:divalent metal cation (Fe/Co/Zn/Cd) transporter